MRNLLKNTLFLIFGGGVAMAAPLFFTDLEGDLDPIPVDPSLIHDVSGLDVTYPPQPDGYLTDYTAELTDEQEIELEAILAQRAIDTKQEVYVLMVEYTRPLTPTGYAKRVQRDWKVRNLVVIETERQRTAMYGKGKAQRYDPQGQATRDWYTAVLDSVNNIENI